MDEWGCWHDVEPGTNPGFLYQQNTMRDAMVAAVTFNIFNRHADRVTMANIAQMVNVLQSVVLTEGEKMVLTPTYHVFDLYKAHQNAQLLDCAVFADNAAEGIKQVSASASVKDGVITVTVANVDAENGTSFTLGLDGLEAKEITGRILEGDMKALNTFEKPDEVTVKPFTAFEKAEGGLRVTLPRCAVVELTIRG